MFLFLLLVALVAGRTVGGNHKEARFVFNGADAVIYYEDYGDCVSAPFHVQQAKLHPQGPYLETIPSGLCLLIVDLPSSTSVAALYHWLQQYPVKNLYLYNHLDDMLALLIPCGNSYCPQTMRKDIFLFA